MTLDFTLLKAGVPYDATSVSIPDGIVRTDTGGVVVAAGANPYTHVSTGFYQFTFTEPAPGLTYQYTRVFVVDGQTLSETKTKTAPATAPAVCYYGTQADLENLIGTSNMIAWSNLLNDQISPDVNRIQVGGNYSDQRINTGMRGGRFNVPLLPGGSGPLLEITDLWARLTAIWLYESRGTRDDATDGVMAVHKKYVAEMLRAYRSGALKLDAGLRYGYAPETPLVVM